MTSPDDQRRKRAAEEYGRQRYLLPALQECMEDFTQGARYEAEIKDRELAALRWFRDEINKRLMPGTTDSQESAYELIAELRAKVEKLEAVAEAARPTVCSHSHVHKECWLDPCCKLRLALAALEDRDG